VDFWTLLADTELLTSVLLYHVVEANIASYMLRDSPSQLPFLTSVYTLEGSSFEIDASSEASILIRLMLPGELGGGELVANVIDANFIASNGESESYSLSYNMPLMFITSGFVSCLQASSM